ncbi:MAG: RNA-binding S4 domain-containing protein [Bacillota bacterium]
MRLDKFLKVSRLIKRRTIAKEVCDGGKIEINGRVAKAGTVVKPGDIVIIKFGERELKAEILETPNAVPAGEAKNLYRILNAP